MHSSEFLKEKSCIKLTEHKIKLFIFEKVEKKNEKKKLIFKACSF